MTEGEMQILRQVLRFAQDKLRMGIMAKKSWG